MVLPDGEKVYTISRFDRIYERDGNVTDGQTDTAWRHVPRLCIASRHKNHLISMKFGTQLHIWNSMIARWPNMKILKIQD